MTTRLKRRAGEAGRGSTHLAQHCKAERGSQRPCCGKGGGDDGVFRTRWDRGKRSLRKLGTF